MAPRISFAQARHLLRLTCTQTMVEYFLDDLLSEAAQSSGVYLTFLPDTGRWPEQTHSLDLPALFSASSPEPPPPPPPPLCIPTSISASATIRAGTNQMSAHGCGPSEAEVLAALANLSASSFEFLAQRRGAGSCQDRRQSPWIFVISRLIRERINDCSIMSVPLSALESLLTHFRDRINREYALSGINRPDVQIESGTGTALMLALLPLTQNCELYTPSSSYQSAHELPATSARDVCSINDMCPDGVANEPPSSGDVLSGDSIARDRPEDSDSFCEAPGECFSL